MSSVTNSGTNWYYCAPGTSEERKRGKYEYMQNVQFYAFPPKKKSSSERRKWLELLRHDLKFDPSRKASNCSLHFMDGKPTSEHPFPDLFAYNNFKKSRQVTVLNYCMFHLKIIIHFAQIKCIRMILIFLDISARSIGV